MSRFINSLYYVIKASLCNEFVIILQGRRNDPKAGGHQLPGARLDYGRATMKKHVPNGPNQPEVVL